MRTPVHLYPRNGSDNHLLAQFTHLTRLISWHPRPKRNGNVNANGCHQLETNIRRRLQDLAPAIAAAKGVTLVAVAHPDDESIQSAASIAEISSVGGLLIVVVLAADQAHRREETLAAMQAAGVAAEQVFLFDFPDGRLADAVPDIENLLRIFAAEATPNLVITHQADIHGDHFAVYRAVRRVFHRGGVTLLHFAIPQAVNSPFLPNTFIRIKDETALWKVHELFPLYASEYARAPGYFDPDMHLGEMIKNGYAAGCRYGESYQAERARLSPCACCGRMMIAPHPRRAGFPPAPVLEFDGDNVSRLVLQPLRDHGLVLASHNQRNGEHNSTNT